jgi:hypothetical protein
MQMSRFFTSNLSSFFSEDFFTWGIIILVLGLMVLSLVWSIWSNKKRKEALQQIALELGFSYTPEDKPFSNELQSSGSFDLFSKGHARKAFNFLRGQRRDALVTVFDYKYTTGGGKNSHTYQQTAVLFNLLASELAQFTLKPRGLWEKMTSKLGAKEMDFSTAAEFTKKYLVKGEDESAIHQMFNPSVLAFFEGQPGLTVEANEKQLLVYRQSKRVKPEELKAFLDNATQLLALMRKPSIDFGYRS